MLKSIFLFLILAISISTLTAQKKEQPDTRRILNSDLLFKKASHQKSGAWFLITGGILAYAAGVIINSKSTYVTSSGWYSLTYTVPNTPPAKSKKGDLLKYGGLGLIAGSIPLFIVSARTHNNASVLLRHEEVSFNHIICDHSIPALAIRINL